MGEYRGLSIGEVARQTGLTERTLRFYEARGLVSPPRTAAGRRIYGAAQLAALHRITVLKRVGFSLAQIGRLLRGPPLADAEIVAQQIAALEAERTAVDRALATLAHARDAVAASESLGIESLCELILLGERKMKHDALNEYIHEHYTPEEQQRWKDAKLAAAGGDAEGYLERWNDLIHRIEAALPLDPSSAAAQRFVVEWDALLRPFVAALDDDMKAQAAIAASTPNTDLGPFIDSAVTDLIEAARAASTK